MISCSVLLLFVLLSKRMLIKQSAHFIKQWLGVSKILYSNKFYFVVSQSSSRSQNCHKVEVNLTTLSFLDITGFKTVVSVCLNVMCLTTKQLRSLPSHPLYNVKAYPEMFLSFLLLNITQLCQLFSHWSFARHSCTIFVSIDLCWQLFMSYHVGPSQRGTTIFLSISFYTFFTRTHTHTYIHSC